MGVAVQQQVDPAGGRAGGMCTSRTCQPSTSRSSVSGHSSLASLLPEHHAHRRAERAQFLDQHGRNHVAQVPDFIAAADRLE